MRTFLISILFLFQGFLFAQESKIVEDSVVENIHKKVGLYVGTGYAVSKFVNTGASFVSMHVGLVFFDRFDLDLSYAVILDNFKKQLIFPSYHKYNQKDISILFQYSLTDWKIRPIAGIGYHYTQASWEPKNEFNDVFKDQINQFEIYTGVNYAVYKAVKVELYCGYKFARDVELVDLEDNSYDGLFFRAMLKIDIFKF